MKVTKKKLSELSSKINQFQKITYEIAKSKGWHDTPRSDGEFLALIHSEVSEALEVLRLPDDKITPQQRKYDFGEELADIIIRVCDFAEVRGVDLGEHLVSKTQKNMKRVYRHGGKKF